MKLTLSILIAAVTFSASAEVIRLSSRHLSVIEQAVQQKCYIYGDLQMLENVETVDRIDQGVVDYYYTTTFFARHHIDQGQYTDYNVVVKSAVFDAYDHTAQDWGMIDVQSVSCKQVD